MTIASAAKPKLAWPVIIFILTLHIGALFALLPGNFSWSAVALALFLHWVTGGLGITLGFHRLVTHRSFQTPKWLEYFLVFCGTLACEGGPIEWVGQHRQHHLHSDKDADPHNSNKGFWWSHITWMLHQGKDLEEIARFCKDIGKDPVYQFLQTYFIPIQVVFGFILYFIGGWSFVTWGIFVRIIAVFHCTWLVNSATHKFGYRTYESDDNSSNGWWVALISYGEGWHNNHHAFQYSARHGLQWWEIDTTWMAIQFLQLLGLAKNIKLAQK
jgi:stearoyl-CoA desaturase (delta-9 desaturase)